MVKMLNICGPITGATVYSDGMLVARDCEFELPEITPMTADLQASGTISLPIMQQIEHMEATAKKIGVDLGFRQMMRFRNQALEIRFVQNVVQTNGVTKDVGCKAFLRGIPTKIPGLSGKVGEAMELEATYAVLRYQLYVDGIEYHCIDKLTGIVKIAGTNYADGLNSML